MKGIRGLILISLLVTGFYTWFGYSIPQSSWEAPRKKELAAGMTPGQLAEAGREIYRKAGCGVCHSLTGEQLRGRDLSRIGAERDGETLAMFLYSGVDVMPPANKPPVNLTDDEITALVAYLQSLGGKPTVRIGDLQPPK